MPSRTRRQSEAMTALNATDCFLVDDAAILPYAVGALSVLAVVLCLLIATLVLLIVVNAKVAASLAQERRCDDPDTAPILKATRKPANQSKPPPSPPPPRNGKQRVPKESEVDDMEN